MLECIANMFLKRKMRTELLNLISEAERLKLTDLDLGKEYLSRAGELYAKFFKSGQNPEIESKLVDLTRYYSIHESSYKPKSAKIVGRDGRFIIN